MQRGNQKYRGKKEYGKARELKRERAECKGEWRSVRGNGKVGGGTGKCKGERESGRGMGKCGEKKKLEKERRRTGKG